MDDILQQAGVTKGALYHHFKNKQDLGYAVLDEVVGAWVHEHWIDPLAQGTDPVSDLLQAIQATGKCMGADGMHNGCPLNNLAQEMSPIDEGFRLRVQRIYGEWQDAIASALQRGLDLGLVDERVAPERTALFIISTIQGVVGILKNDRRPETRESLNAGLMDFLNSLRARTSGKRA
jgi:AcrR family transcriptional regulator